MKQFNSPNLPSTFNERLQYLREHKHPVVSSRITSVLIGLGHDSLRKYERGEREPGLTELKLIADYYGVSLDELCFGEEKHLIMRKFFLINCPQMGASKKRVV